MADDDQSISRKRKMDNQSQSLSVDDLLSDLPLSIIHHILALIPIRDAVRTCVLSSKWRFIWASLPHLVFNSGCRENFIANALLLHKGPIHKFRCLGPCIPHRATAVDPWLLYLSRSEIRDLFLVIGTSYGKLLRVHSNLYSCRMLSHLELWFCELRPPPLTFNGFSFLRSLVLHCVEVPCNVLESLVAKSPLLENLTCDTPAKLDWTGRTLARSELRISAPKLKHFHLCGRFDEISLCAPLVADVFVSLTGKIRSPTAAQPRQERLVCNYANFLGGFTNLESLRGKLFFTEYLSIGIEFYNHCLVFHRLKFIQLHNVCFLDMKQVTVVAHLLTGAPNLHKLKISICAEDADGASFIPFSGFECTPNFTFKKLRFVKMKGVRDLSYEAELIKHLLKSSPVLETMNLYWGYRLLPEAVLKLATGVLRYRRASPNAEIFLTEGLV